MEHAEDVHKNFVDHEEAESHADRVATPVKQEHRIIAAPHIRGEHDREGRQLRHDVAKEELEIAQQAALQHHAGDSHLQNGMHEPQHVVENLDFFAHACISGGGHVLYRRKNNDRRTRTKGGLPPGDVVGWEQNQSNFLQPGVQRTAVIVSNVTAGTASQASYLSARQTRAVL